jgi:hypothetical protein
MAESLASDVAIARLIQKLRGTKSVSSLSNVEDSADRQAPDRPATKLVGSESPESEED